MDDIIIKSYEDLIKKIEKIISKEPLTIPGDLRGYFFRGHANKDWKLIPTLLRNDDVVEDKELQELLIDNLQKSKISLAVAQHYGKKTRCLDFTRNYKVALYFACNPKSNDYDKDGAIFILEKSYHKPNWFTNYLIYYTATNPKDVVTNWDYAKFISTKKEIINEFKRTGRSLKYYDVNNEIQSYLSNGFMVDFYDNDYGFGRIKKQEASLYYFGSKYYYIENDIKHYVSLDYLECRLSSQDNFYIELHNLSNPNLEDSQFCTKIIIPQHLKKEIFEKINIKAEDLGL